MSTSTNRTGHNGNSYVCPISLELLAQSDIYVLNCGHSFSDQIVRAVAERALTSCPLCRAEITTPPVRNWALQNVLGDMTHTNSGELNDIEALQEGERPCPTDESKQQIAAFVKTNESLVATNESLVAMINTLNTTMGQREARDEDRYKRLWGEIQIAKEKLAKYKQKIQDLKRALRESECRNDKPGSINDTPTNQTNEIQEELDKYKKRAKDLSDHIQLLYHPRSFSERFTNWGGILFSSNPFPEDDFSPDPSAS